MRINTFDIIGKEFKVSRRIMVCDDEPFNVQGLIIVLKAVVKKMGVSEKLVDELVDKCYNGKEAVELIKKQAECGEQYALIFMDCSMPILDGYEATTEIRKICSN